MEYRIEEAVAGKDVIMMLRIQKERGGTSFIPSIKEYSSLYCLKESHLKKAKDNVIIMHPGPINRGVEISDTRGGRPLLGNPQPGGERCGRQDGGPLPAQRR